MLYHTSPNKIEKITDDGVFGSFLFFSGSEYVMTAGAHVTYEIDEEALNIIEASDIFFDYDPAEVPELQAVNPIVSL